VDCIDIFWMLKVQDLRIFVVSVVENVSTRHSSMAKWMRPIETLPAWIFCLILMCKCAIVMDVIYCSEFSRKRVQQLKKYNKSHFYVLQNAEGTILETTQSFCSVSITMLRQ